MPITYGFRGEGLRQNHSLQKHNIEALSCSLLYLPVRDFEGGARGRAPCFVWDMNCKPSVFLSDFNLPYFEPSIYAVIPPSIVFHPLPYPMLPLLLPGLLFTLFSPSPSLPSSNLKRLASWGSNQPQSLHHHRNTPIHELPPRRLRRRRRDHFPLLNLRA